MDQVSLTLFCPALEERHGGQMWWVYNGQHEEQIPMGGGDRCGQGERRRSLSGTRRTWWWQGGGHEKHQKNG